jgi:uncharacterized protein (DUF736 family)
MEKKDNLGVLFIDNKRTNEKAPHYRGNAVINGVEVKMSAWVNVSKKDGSKYLSLKFENPVQEQAKPTGKPTYGNKDFDDFLGSL